MIYYAANHYDEKKHYNVNYEHLRGNIVALNVFYFVEKHSGSFFRRLFEPPLTPARLSRKFFLEFLRKSFRLFFRSLCCNLELIFFLGILECSRESLFRRLMLSMLKFIPFWFLMFCGALVILRTATDNFWDTDDFWEMISVGVPKIRCPPNPKNPQNHQINCGRSNILLKFTKTVHIITLYSPI